MKPGMSRGSRRAGIASRRYLCPDMLGPVRPTRPGSLIHAARLKAGLSQASLAGRAGTTQPTISMYERGTKVPDLATLERILGAAGFELRMVLAPLEDHDESLARYVQSLPQEAQKRFTAAQRARVDT